MRFSPSPLQKSCSIGITIWGLLALALACAPCAQARVQAFQALAPSPADLTALVADPTAGLIYAQEDEGKKFFSYDPRTDVWTELAEAPLDSKRGGGAAYLDGRIYLSYTEEPSRLSVYDVASGTWTTIANPLGEGTGDITASDGLLYMAERSTYISYDPASGVTTTLAGAPGFPTSDCPSRGLEPWGGLEPYEGRIYAHQGSGCTGFGVYELATGRWSELPRVPEEDGEGATLGSAVDPVTGDYLTAGPYLGRNLYRYDVEAGSWSTLPLPFDVEDDGMAYLSLPGHEGVYVAQGDLGRGFARYTEADVTDLSLAISAGVRGTAKGGEITYSIQVTDDGPERASGVTVSASLPAGTTLVAARGPQGGCTGTSILTCGVGALPAGAGAAVSIEVSAPFGFLTDSATVSSLAIDGDPADDTATLVTEVPGCIVPELRGRPVKVAEKALRAVGCRPGKVVRRGDRGLRRGRVIRTGRRPGSALAAGAKVGLVVSEGPRQGRRPHRHRASHHGLRR